MAYLVPELPADDPIGVGVSDNLGRLVPEPANTDGVWADYQVTNKYVNHRQTWMLPLAGASAFNGQSVAFVDLASPTTLLVVEWTGCRWNDVPTLPNPTLADPGWVLLYVMPDAVMKILAPDGVSPLYRVNGTYVYGKRDPASNVFADVRFPQPPWMNAPGTPRSVSPGKFADGIIDDGQPDTFTIVS